MSAKWPRYEDLPPVKGMPAGCAWGLFDKDGEKDVYGCLNKVTKEAVLDAVASVKDAHSISLK